MIAPRKVSVETRDEEVVLRLHPYPPDSPHYQNGAHIQRLTMTHGEALRMYLALSDYVAEEEAK